MNFFHHISHTIQTKLIVNATSIGNNITSSKYPNTGIKSGTKSIGESVYATVIPAKILASIEVSSSFNAKNKAGISIFNFLFAASHITIIIQTQKQLRQSLAL